MAKVLYKANCYVDHHSYKLGPVDTKEQAVALAVAWLQAWGQVHQGRGGDMPDVSVYEETPEED